MITSSSRITARHYSYRSQVGKLLLDVKTREISAPNSYGLSSDVFIVLFTWGCRRWLSSLGVELSGRPTDERLQAFSKRCCCCCCLVASTVAVSRECRAGVCCSSAGQASSASSTDGSRLSASRPVCTASSETCFPYPFEVLLCFRYPPSGKGSKGCASLALMHSIQSFCSCLPRGELCSVIASSPVTLIDA